MKGSNNMIVINNTGDQNLNTGVLVGSIVLWYGSASAVPSGYQLCNGSGGVPNLMGKFVRGAANSGELLTTSGSATHLHSGNTSGLNGGHSHSYSISVTSNGYYNYGSGTGTAYAVQGHSHTVNNGSTSQSANHAHASSGVSSLGSSLPLHRLLYWIKRIS